MDLEERIDFEKGKDCSFSWKVMATVFWVIHEVILIDYLQKGRTVTGEYYVSLLDKLQTRIAKIRPRLQKKIWFHQDNTLYYTSVVAVTKIHELRFKLFRSYSSQLTLNDLFLFPKLKVVLGGQRFSSNEKTIVLVKNVFAEKDGVYYLDELNRWEHRLKKYIVTERVWK